MNTRNRLIDINETDLFEPTEVTFERDNLFKSWEFYSIVHLTNEELYYLDDEIQRNYESLADVQQNTERGIIYCFS